MPREEKEIYRGVIAIDGPAGAGKSTVAKAVADALKWAYVDTGAMYRAITLLAMRRGITPEESNQKDFIDLLKSAKLNFKPTCNGLNIYLNGENISEAIRQPDVTNNVSYYSKIPSVRQVLTNLQRELAKTGGIVMEGRDIGTVVLPDADNKFFITASPFERARRRQKDLIKSGYEVELQQLVQEIEQRDQIDSNRVLAPLKPAEDAIILDTSEMSVAEVVDKIVAEVGKK